MNRLNIEERTAIIRCLIEGNSIRSTAPITGAARNTITSLLVALGKATSEYQDRTLRNLRIDRIECDEIWSFCYAKAKNVPEQHSGEFGYGDVWTWTAIDPDSKLVPGATRSTVRSASSVQSLMRRSQWPCSSSLGSVPNSLSRSRKRRPFSITLVSA
jgi:hypothetical protein